ncbi:MAG: TadE/TadG family type IV pilus assembly protein [Chloroflexota bacterium]
MATIAIRLNRPCGVRGQSVAEFAVVAPLALLAIFGIISIGLWVFYQQQVTNVAREAARYAAIHSATAPCPTSGWRDPQAPPPSYRLFPLSCDGPANPNDPYPWPNMTDHARSSVWGTPPTSVHVNACWSGFVPAGTPMPSPPDYSAASGFPLADHPAIEGGVDNTFVQCRIAGIDPTTTMNSLACAQGMTTDADDPASDIPFNQVTAYACMEWAPPLAGFLVIPSNVTLRAVVTEVIHRQQ